LFLIPYTEVLRLFAFLNAEFGSLLNAMAGGAGTISFYLDSKVALAVALAVALVVVLLVAFPV
jgi:hypothetical protein